MATYTDIAKTATLTQFQRRVAYALTVASIAAYNELGTVPGHALRAIFATKVLNGQANILSAALGVLANSTVAAEANSGVLPDNSIPDADIQFAINSIFSALAGA